MLKTDIPVWWRFVEQYELYIKEIYYDVEVGGIALTPEQQKDPIWRAWQRDVAKRIDALCVTDRGLWIVEVSKIPSIRALGQLLLYKELWREDPKLPGPVELLLVCEDIDADMLSPLAKAGIKPILV